MTLQDRLRRIARRRAQRSVGRRRGGSAARGSSSPSEASRWRGEAARHLLYERAMDGFAYLYYTEATLKILGLGPFGYFGESWCRFDFVLVCT